MSPTSAPGAAEVASTLASLLDEPLVVIDVGCRWGFADSWERLGDRCIAIGFDPDEEECERLREHYRDRPWLRIVAHALGASAGPATLHVTREPGQSSVYEPLDEVVDRHPRLDPMRAVKRVPVELIRLDDWCADNEVERVDLVKLDTQASELDVLRGAERTLRSVSMVQTEVEFNPLYESQPLFGDVDRFLRDRGFVLWRLDNLSHHRQHAARAAMHPAWLYYDYDEVRFTRRSGQLFWADAVFVRVDVARPERVEWPVALRRACLAASLGLDELAGLALDAHAGHLRGPDRETVEGARRLLPRPDDETGWVTGVVSRDTAGPPESPVPGTTLIEPLVVSFFEPIEGHGWREPAPVAGVPARFTGPSRRAWVDLPVRLPAGSGIELVVVEFDLRQCDALALTANDAVVPMEWRADPPRVIGAGRVPDDYDNARDFTRVTITTPEPTRRPTGIDPRKFGIAVSELRLVPPRS